MKPGYMLAVGILSLSVTTIEAGGAGDWCYVFNHVWDCCKTWDQGPCWKGNGDCDSDSECYGAWVCGTDNCDPRYYPSGADCCFDLQPLYVDLDFDTTAMIFSETPRNIDSHSDNNGGSGTNSAEYTFSSSQTATSSFDETHGGSNTHSLEISKTTARGLEIGAAGKIFGATASVSHEWSETSSVTTEQSWTYGETQEESTTREWSKTVHFDMPPHTVTKITMVLTEAQSRIPYTGVIHYNDGSTKNVTGVWTGVDTGNLVVDRQETTHVTCYDTGCDNDVFCDWIDAAHRPCPMYRTYNWCEEDWVPDYAVDGVDAREACCICKGGHDVLLREEAPEAAKYISVKAVSTGAGLSLVFVFLGAVVKKYRRGRYQKVETVHA